MTQTTNDQPELLTARQIGKRGLLKERTIRRLIAEKRIPVIRSGRTQYVNYTALVAMLNSGQGAIWQHEN